MLSSQRQAGNRKLSLSDRPQGPTAQADSSPRKISQAITQKMRIGGQSELEKDRVVQPPPVILTQSRRGAKEKKDLVSSLCFPLPSAPLREMISGQ